MYACSDTISLNDILSDYGINSYNRLFPTSDTSLTSINASTSYITKDTTLYIDFCDTVQTIFFKAALSIPGNNYDIIDSISGDSLDQYSRLIYNIDTVLQNIYAEYNLAAYPDAKIGAGLLTGGIMYVYNGSNFIGSKSDIQPISDTSSLQIEFIPAGNCNSNIIRTITTHYTGNRDTCDANNTINYVCSDSSQITP